jgi:hypothetical protein
MRILLYRAVVVPSDARFLRSFENLLLPRLMYDPNQVIACRLSCLLCRTLLAMGVADQPPSRLQDLCPGPVPDELRP